MRYLTAGLVVGLLGAAAARGDIGAARPAIDAVFAAWSRPGHPGCALAVAEHGEVTYARGYGTANLESGTPITPETIFDIGSVSKQFTAMAVILLVRDGKLALGDDIRRYLPELPDYGRTITVGDLLHHTSGLRNYTDLFDLAGVPEVSLTTARDALELIVRQRGVNFAAGEEFLYSDTNYFLAGEIVARVSGESLRAFSARRIFAPLGMTSTRINDRPREVVPGRAVGYEPSGGGYLNYLSNFEQVGDGSVLTSVLDLARWDRNFVEGTVGGHDGVALLTTTARLRNGEATPYGAGVFVDEYRGLPWQHHDGEWVGYRAAISRFPSEGLSVFVECNTLGELDTDALALGVARVLLGAKLTAPALNPDVADATGVARYAGTYWSPERGTVRRFEQRDGALWLGSAGAGAPLESVAPGVYRTGGEGATRYRFVTDQPAGIAQLEATSYGTTAKYYRVSPPVAGEVRPADYAGTYHSADLPAPWSLVARDGKLWRRQAFMHDVELTPVFADSFVGALSEGDFLIHFVRDDDGGRVTGLLVSGEMLRPMLLVREPAGAKTTP